VVVGPSAGEKPVDYAAFKVAYRSADGRGAWLGNNGYNKELAEQAVADGLVDLVAFGNCSSPIPISSNV
jgi:N-ethylmaleimide reductase